MNEAFEKWWFEHSAAMSKIEKGYKKRTAELAYEAGRDAVELRTSKALGGLPESELWGDGGLIAATMRIVDAYEATPQWRPIEIADQDEEIIAWVGYDAPSYYCTARNQWVCRASGDRFDTAPTHFQPRLKGPKQ